MWTEEGEETSPRDCRSVSPDKGWQHFSRNKQQRAHGKVRGNLNFCSVKGCGSTITAWTQSQSVTAGAKQYGRSGNAQVCPGSGTRERECSYTERRGRSCFLRPRPEQNGCSWNGLQSLTQRWSKVQWHRNTFPAPSPPPKGCLNVFVI